jgi:hypothetical protein
LKIERVKYKIPTLDITIRYVYDRKVKWWKLKIC